jgi:pimeloyl-ACP methyl ester carboxylesterase
MPSLNLPSGVRVDYDAVGEGAPIVLLPGLGSRRAAWLEVTQALGERYRVYACDLRSHPRSHPPDSPTPERFSIADLAEDIALFMKVLGIAGAVIIGHSQGGFVALELSLAHPALVRALVLAATASYTDDYGRALLHHWRALAERGDRQLLVDDLFLWNFSPHFCNERTRDARLLRSLVRRGAFDVEAFILHTLACEKHETRSRLPALRLPVLLLGGESDIVMTLRHNVLLRELMPQSELVTLPRVGHHLVAEAPEAVLPPITAFLDRLGAAREPARAAGGAS